MSKILIVVDMQQDFVTGALGTAEARAIVPAVAARVEAAKADGDTVIFTLDTHQNDYLDTNEGRHLPAVHCVKGTDGHRLVPPLWALSDGCRKVEKPTFGSLGLMDELADMARACGMPEGNGMQIELCGVCTDICVVTNALLIKTRLPEAELTVRAGLCAGVTPEKHQAALEVLSSCHVQVI